MPEGPSIVLAREAIEVFVGKKVIEASGSSLNVEYGSLHGAKIKSVKSWGKHLLISFEGFTIRVHFLMFGSYTVNNPKKNRIPKLSILFARGKSLNFYACSIVTLQGPLRKQYDWTGDVLNKRWDPEKALTKLRKQPNDLVSDALLDQTIFAGVGNIIKNEILHRTKIHPESMLRNIPLARKRELIKQAVVYSKEFLKWKRAFELKKHWQVYTKKICPRDQHVITKKYLGSGKRRTFYCEACQKLYT
jgi:endonuclease VIII